MADTRARRRAMLRLRVALDEGGWRLTRIVARRPQPYPTEDRLETVRALARQCGVIGEE